MLLILIRLCWILKNSLVHTMIHVLIWLPVISVADPGVQQTCRWLYKVCMVPSWVFYSQLHRRRISANPAIFFSCSVWGLPCTHSPALVPKWDIFVQSINVKIKKDLYCTYLFRMLFSPGWSDSFFGAQYSPLWICSRCMKHLLQLLRA